MPRGAGDFMSQPIAEEDAVRQTGQVIMQSSKTSTFRLLKPRPLIDNRPWFDFSFRPATHD